MLRTMYLVKYIKCRRKSEFIENVKCAHIFVKCIKCGRKSELLENVKCAYIFVKCIKCGRKSELQRNVKCACIFEKYASSPYKIKKIKICIQVQAVKKKRIFEFVILEV